MASNHGIYFQDVADSQTMQKMLQGSCKMLPVGLTPWPGLSSWQDLAKMAETSYSVGACREGRVVLRCHLVDTAASIVKELAIFGHLDVVRNSIRIASSCCSNREESCAVKTLICRDDYASGPCFPDGPIVGI